MGREEISAMLRIISSDQQIGQAGNAHSQRQRTVSKDSDKDKKRAGGGGPRYTSLAGGDGVQADLEDPHDVGEAPLSTDEVTVINGVLGHLHEVIIPVLLYLRYQPLLTALAKKTIKDIYIPLEQVDMLSADNFLDEEIITVIDRVGHSRLPVFRGLSLRPPGLSTNRSMVRRRPLEYSGLPTGEEDSWTAQERKCSIANWLLTAKQATRFGVRKDDFALIFTKYPILPARDSRCWTSWLYSSEVRVTSR